jgi:hypothetical protein
MVDTITNDGALTGAGIGFAGDPNTLVTELAIKEYVDTEVAKPLDIPTAETILFEKDTLVAGYTLKIDKDDMIVYITKGSDEGGAPAGTGEADYGEVVWGHTHTIPGAGDHNHWWYDPYHQHPDAGSSDVFFDQNGAPRPHPGKGPENIIYQAKKDKGLAGPLYTSNGLGVDKDSGDVPAYRMPGRNFTRQTRN